MGEGRGTSCTCYSRGNTNYSSSRTGSSRTEKYAHSTSVDPSQAFGQQCGWHSLRPLSFFYSPSTSPDGIAVTMHYRTLIPSYFSPSHFAYMNPSCMRLFRFTPPTLFYSVIYTIPFPFLCSSDQSGGVFIAPLYTFMRDDAGISANASPMYCISYPFRSFGA